MLGGTQDGTGKPGRHPLDEPGLQQQPFGHETLSQPQRPSLHRSPLPHAASDVHHGGLGVTGAHTTVGFVGVTVRVPNWSVPVSVGGASPGHFTL
jgi:hypothetical protein